MAIFKDKKDLASYFDHTVLKAEASLAQVDKVCEEALTHEFFGVCVNSCHIARVAKALSKSSVVPLTVVGFPLGAMETSAKVYETKKAVELGAREIDTVVNLGLYFSGSKSEVAKDIGEVVKAAGESPVKVILETCYLKPDEIKELTAMSVDQGALFVKTSTGFGSRGASVEDIMLMQSVLQQKNLVGKVGIKASGGIKDLAFVTRLVEAGATRIGASASVNILQEL